MNERWRSPRPVSSDVVGTESEPRGNDRSQVPSGVIDGRENGTVLSVNQFGDQKRRGAMGNGNTETNEETTGNKHLKVDGNSLESDTQQPGLRLELTGITCRQIRDLT